MTEAEILHIYNHNEVRQLARTRFPDCWEDILQDLAIILHTVDLSLSCDELKRYACRVLINMSAAKRGKVAQRYKHLEPLPENIELPDQPGEQLPTIEDVTRGLHWFHEGVFRLYLKHGTIEKVSRITGIPQRTVSGSVKIAQKKIKAQW